MQCSLLMHVMPSLRCIGSLLHNMQYLCPPLSRYLQNLYGVPSRLFVEGVVELSSDEGTAQGDLGAMPGYGIGVLHFFTSHQA